VEPLHTRGNFSAKYEKTGEWKFKLSNVPISGKSASSAKDYKIRLKMLDIASKPPNITFTGKGKKAKGTFKYTVQLPEVKTTTAIAELTTRSASLIGNANLGNNLEEGILGTTAFELKASNTDIDANSLAIRIPEITLTGEGHYPKDSPKRMDVTAKFVNAEASDAKLKTKITGINGEIPFQWPYNEKGKRGKISVKNIHWDKLKLGTISGTLRQKGLGIVFEGSHKNTLLSGLTLNFNGESGFFSKQGFELVFNFRIPRIKTAPVDLGKFHPAGKGIIFGGNLELDGKMFADARSIKCSMHTKLQDSRLEIKDKGLTIKGASLDLSVPNLFDLSSASNQQFRFEKVLFGELTFSEGKIEFQIESPKSIFLEKSGFKWCNGHVYTHAIRIRSGETDYDIVLYCDRLKLAEILDQFGVAKAQGDGTVNGRIPLKFEKGKLIFDDGFLYSTPGDGGKVRITGTEMLTAGIPKNTPQYSQLEFAREALESFNYNWVKLLLTTEGENLLLQLHLDGKPAKPLPFTYKKELGTFARIEAGSRKGIEHPIHLNVNFRLPLDKFLHYGKKITDVMHMMK
jgi:hypothetical protein